MNKRECKILTHAFFPTQEKIDNAISGLANSLSKFDWKVEALSGAKFVGLSQIKIYEVWKALHKNRGGKKYTMLVDTDCAALKDPMSAFEYVDKYCSDSVLVSCAHEGAWPIRAWGPFMSQIKTPSGRTEDYFIQLNTGVICGRTDLIIDTMKIIMDEVCASPEQCDQHAFYVAHNKKTKIGINTQVDGDSILSISMAELNWKNHFESNKNGVKRINCSFCPVFAHMNGYVKSHQGVKDDFSNWSGTKLP